MDPTGDGTTRVRWYLARDAQKRDVFVPWHPFSRAAYVLRGPVEREELRHRLQLFFAFAVGVAIGIGFAGIFSDQPGWVGILSIALVLAYWGWWTWRYTRGLERTRYEKPAG